MPDETVRIILEGRDLATDDIKRVRGELSALRGLGNSLRQNFVSDFRTMATVGSAAFVGIGVAAVKFGADFEETMSRIAGLTAIPKDAVNGLRDDLLSLSKDVAKSPTELGAAAYQVLSSGITDVSIALEVTKRSAQAATAGLGQSADVARVLTSVINAYGLAASDVDRITNQLVATVKLGSGEATDFALSLGRVIPIAAQMGVSFDQIGAVLATLTNVGVSADIAVTNLRSILSQILKPTDDSVKVFKALGFEMSDLRDGIEHDFIGTMTKLFQVIGDNSEVFAAIFPDVRGLTGALGAFSQAGDATRANARGIKEDVTALGDAFAVTSNTLNFQFRKALNEVRVELTQFGIEALPTLKQGLKDIPELLQWFIDHRAALVAAITAVGIAFVWAHPLGAVVVGIGAIISAMELLRTENDQLGKSALQLKEKVLEAFIGIRESLDFGLREPLSHLPGWFSASIGPAARESKRELEQMRAELEDTRESINRLKQASINEAVAAERASLKDAGLVRVLDLEGVAANRAAAASFAAGQGFAATGQQADAAVPEVNALTASLLRAYQAGGLLAEQQLSFGLQLQPFGGSITDFIHGIKDQIAAAKAKVQLPGMDINLGDLTGDVGDAIDEVNTLWIEGARRWMQTIHDGIVSGRITIRDAFDFIKDGFVNAGRSIIDEMARIQTQNEEVWRIIGETVERGTIRVQDIARLFDLGEFGKQAADDFVRALSGLPSRIEEEIWDKIRADAMKAALDAAVAIREAFEQQLTEAAQGLEDIFSRIGQILQQETVESAQAHLDIMKLQLTQMDAIAAADEARTARLQQITSLEETLNSIRESGAARFAQLEEEVGLRREESVLRVRGLEEELQGIRRQSEEIARALAGDQGKTGAARFQELGRDRESLQSRLEQVRGRMRERGVSDEEQARLEQEADNLARQLQKVTTEQRALEHELRRELRQMERKEKQLQKQVDKEEELQATLDEKLEKQKQAQKEREAALQAEIDALKNTKSAAELYAEQLQHQIDTLQQAEERQRLMNDMLAIQLQLNNDMLPIQAELNTQLQEQINLFLALGVVFQRLRAGVFTASDAAILAQAGFTDLANAIAQIVAGVIPPSLFPGVGALPLGLGHGGGAAGTIVNVYPNNMIFQGTPRESLEGLGISLRT